jgi:hypothetical protein
MRPRKRRETGERDLFRSRLDQIIDMGHALVKLAGTVDWRFLEERFGGHCHVVARRTRKACVLHIFKRPRLPRAKCSSPWRESLGAWRLM